MWKILAILSTLYWYNYDICQSQHENQPPVVTMKRPVVEYAMAGREKNAIVNVCLVLTYYREALWFIGRPFDLSGGPLIYREALWFIGRPFDLSGGPLIYREDLWFIGRTFDLSGGPLIFLEKKVCILDTFLRESCIYFYL